MLLFVVAFLIVIFIFIFAFMSISKKHDFDDLTEMAEEICATAEIDIPAYTLAKSNSKTSQTIFYEKDVPQIQIYDTDDIITLRIVFIHELTHVILNSEKHNRQFEDLCAKLTLIAIDLGYLNDDDEIDESYPCK